MLNAAAMIEDGSIQKFVDERYAGWKSGIGDRMLARDVNLAELADYALENNVTPTARSGRQELLENHVTRFTK